MFKRKRTRRRPPLPFRYVFMISVIIFSLLTVQGLWFVEAGIKPTLMEIAKAETQRIAQQAINEAVTKKMVSDFEDLEERNDLIITEKDNDGNIVSARISTNMFNHILSEATMQAQDYLNQIERGEINQYSAIPDDINLEYDDESSGIIHYIPLGQATRNALLANLGPKVPVRFRTIGEVQSRPDSNVKVVGINNVWVEVNIRLDVDVDVVIPFGVDTEKVSTNVPIVYTLINGEVPQFYGPGSENPPAINLPDG